MDLNSFAEDEADGEGAAEAYVFGDPNGSWAEKTALSLSMTL